MDPVKVLRLVASLGEAQPKVRLVVCQIEDLGGEQGHMGLGYAVSDAVDDAVSEIRTLVENFLNQTSAGTQTPPPIENTRNKLRSATAPGGIT